MKGSWAGWEYETSLTANRSTVRTYTRDSANFSLIYPGAPTDFYVGRLDYQQRIANLDLRPVQDAMLPVLAEGGWAKGRLPAGYRYAGTQAIRVDLAEKILRAAFDGRAVASAAHPKERNRAFRLDMALAVSVGMEAENARRLLGSAGFRCDRARALAEGAAPRASRTARLPRPMARAGALWHPAFTAPTDPLRRHDVRICLFPAGRGPRHP